MNEEKMVWYDSIADFDAGRETEHRKGWAVIFLQTDNVKKTAEERIRNLILRRKPSHKIIATYRKI